MPTIKQKLAASKLVENGGIIGKAMISAGYSPATARTPQKLTERKGWKELMNKYLPDDKLLKKHNELLDKKEYIVIGKIGEREVIPTGEIDPNAVARGLDLAYKLKGRYKEGATINQKVNLPVPIFGGLSVTNLKSI